MKFILVNVFFFFSVVKIFLRFIFVMNRIEKRGKMVIFLVGFVIFLLNCFLSYY